MFFIKLFVSVLAQLYFQCIWKSNHQLGILGLGLQWKVRFTCTICMCVNKACKICQKKPWFKNKIWLAILRTRSCIDILKNKLFHTYASSGPIFSDSIKIAADIIFIMVLTETLIQIFFTKYPMGKHDFIMQHLDTVCQLKPLKVQHFMWAHWIFCLGNIWSWQPG